MIGSLGVVLWMTWKIHYTDRLTCANKPEASSIFNKPRNPIRSTLAVQSLAWLCFFVSGWPRISLSCSNLLFIVVGFSYTHRNPTWCYTSSLWNLKNECWKWMVSKRKLQTSRCPCLGFRVVSCSGAQVVDIVRMFVMSTLQANVWNPSPTGLCTGFSAWTVATPTRRKQ